MCIIYVHIYSYMDINVCYTHACIYMYIHTHNILHKPSQKNAFICHLPL